MVKLNKFAKRFSAAVYPQISLAFKTHKTKNQITLSAIIEHFKAINDVIFHFFLSLDTST